jgi:hypothetical protein
MADKITTLDDAADWLADQTGETVRRYSSVGRWVPRDDRSEVIELQRDEESISVPAEFTDATLSLVPRSRSILGGGLYLFMGVPGELVIKKLQTQYHILTWMGTASASHDLDPEDIAVPLYELSKIARLLIIGAVHNACTIWFPNTPDDLDEVVRRLSEICPDLRTQICTEEQLREGLRTGQLVRLWWD